MLEGLNTIAFVAFDVLYIEEWRRGRERKRFDSESWSSLSRSSNNSEQVVTKRVTEMLCKVLNRTFSSYIGLEVEAKHGKHG
ncbi:hypothetical protein L6164_008254 [Bauhinia variegata]|uniref:Uncharacterized protein n=1 Tax=Bauhinia variegata TaxID=167791 RepID=A0ACB9PG83_BAUVA|nr:hypothetical protein L6164_008254 [Bauhinia variegata]